MNNNRLYIAAAGAGKTTFLVNYACELSKNDGENSIAIITYTQKNQQEIRNRFTKEIGFVPPRIKICGWYDFLLTYCIRPFMGAVIEELRCRSVGLILVNNISGTFKTKDGRYIKTYKADDINKKFLADNNHIYSDKLSEFAYNCYEARRTQFCERMNNIFSHILIDEVQDLSAWDYNIISVLLKIGNLHTIMCGDLRQKTYSTTPGTKWAKYKGRIDEFLRNEINTKKHKYVDIDCTTLNYSHRFGKEIADFASLIIGDVFPKTEPCHCEDCIRRQEMFKGGKGIFLLKRCDIASFISKYKPMALIWDKRHYEQVDTYICNYGEAKGIAADVCMIFPTKTILSKFLSSKQNQLGDNTRSKFYVAVTRARYISAIVIEDNFDNNKIGLPFWNNNES